ncbi:MAG TPA: BON domain-containing protein [Longimicrobiales bacterium]
MSERSGKRTDRSESHTRQRTTDEPERDARNAGDVERERDHRGSADDAPGSVPGASHGAGGHPGAYGPTGEHDPSRAAELERGDWVDPSHSPIDWPTGSGADRASRDTPPHGSGSNRRSDHERRQQATGSSGYAEQGFGAGERRGWGGGPRGGYGGGQVPGEQRYERGRGPRSWGPDGWGADAPWQHSEFAGRGEFGSGPLSEWNEEVHAARAAQETRPPREQWTVPGPYSGCGPQDYRRSEAAIREDVCERLTRHGEVDASRITVRVENDEVILEGYVDSRAAKRMAEDTAESVSGVRDVHNRLRID